MYDYVIPILISHYLTLIKKPYTLPRAQYVELPLSFLDTTNARTA